MQRVCLLTDRKGVGRLAKHRSWRVTVTVGADTAMFQKQDQIQVTKQDQIQAQGQPCACRAVFDSVSSGVPARRPGTSNSSALLSGSDRPALFAPCRGGLPDLHFSRQTPRDRQQSCGITAGLLQQRPGKPCNKSPDRTQNPSTVHQRLGALPTPAPHAKST